MIKVTPLPTGTAQLKFAQQCGGDGRSALQRKLDIFRDKRWVGPWPNLCWLIEHPEGRYIVDTGDTCLDVWYRYPTTAGTVLPATQPFHKLGNVIMTPHVAGWTQGMLEARAKLIAENIERIARGEAPLNRIEPNA